MPLYEYYCADCQTTFDTIRPMSQADTAIQCKSCESLRTSRMLSLFAAHVKGDSKTSTTTPDSGAFSGGCCSGGLCGCGH